MALSPQLLQYKSSGVYRLEFDKSQTSNIPSGTLRLVVGHSKKGPYNSPVLISTTEQFIEVFGSIDRNLEKKGMFFHRSALAALTRGPILALNLAGFDSNDLIDYAAMVTNGSDAAATSIVGDSAYHDYFNTEKFWSPSDEALNSVVGTAEDNVLRFANIKQDNITVIVRQAQDVKPFDILARDWYGEGNVPAYLNSFDYVSDFMVDVFVFKGDFNAAAMATDPVYGEYFTSAGLDKTKLDEFANLRQVSLLAKYTGSILPNFTDKEGNNLYIESIVNAEARRTGLFCAVNEDAVLDETGTKADLIGHSYAAGVSYELLSYNLGADERSYDLDAYLNYDKSSGAFVQFTAVNGVGTLDLVAGDYILGEEPGRMVKVLRIAKETIGTDVVYTVYTSAEANDNSDFKGYKSFEKAESHYVPFVLEGANIASQSIKNCLDAVNLGTGLANALVDKDTIDFRYIVDTFSSYDNGSLLNKVQLSALAKERQNASAILNAPFISEFKKSTNPSFTDANGAFDINYIATGGNLDKNPTALFALPGINDGANYAFYYTALVVRENNKDIIVPAAGYVSNNFIDKYTDSSPWAIVAGPRRGVISGAGIVGAEYAFDKSDRDVLEPFGINPIVFQRGAGLTILGNKTAQQSVQSALSSAHVREVLIYIQDGLAAILKDYVFEFNTPQTRLEIKTLADSFLESVKADGGVYEFKNVMDSTNNTNEVIDANIGILDTFVEPVKGLEIVVQRTTVLNTGEIATGNFS
jgi:hypothetical protein